MRPPVLPELELEWELEREPVPEPQPQGSVFPDSWLVDL
eukprot:COSAG06_NODE_61672_length_267_cov_0.607143_1_plen_38_part_10